MSAHQTSQQKNAANRLPPQRTMCNYWILFFITIIMILKVANDKWWGFLPVFLFFFTAINRTVKYFEKIQSHEYEYNEPMSLGPVLRSFLGSLLFTLVYYFSTQIIVFFQKEEWLDYVWFLLIFIIILWGKTLEKYISFIHYKKYLRKHPPQVSLSPISSPNPSKSQTQSLSVPSPSAPSSQSSMATTLKPSYPHPHTLMPSSTLSHTFSFKEALNSIKKEEDTKTSVVDEWMVYCKTCGKTQSLSEFLMEFEKGHHVDKDEETMFSSAFSSPGKFQETLHDKEGFEYLSSLELYCSSCGSRDLSLFKKSQ